MRRFTAIERDVVRPSVLGRIDTAASLIGAEHGTYAAAQDVLNMQNGMQIGMGIIGGTQAKSALRGSGRRCGMKLVILANGQSSARLESN